jgi:probable HAF family extracellular repeat protein
MAHWKTFGLTTFAVLGLLETAGSANAQCATSSELPTTCATEWGGGQVIGLTSGTGSIAYGINDAGQAIGQSLFGGVINATEWIGGGVINLGGLSGNTSSVATAINQAGQVVGFSRFGDGDTAIATEWTGGVGGSIINLGRLPGSTGSEARGSTPQGRWLVRATATGAPTPPSGAAEASSAYRTYQAP